MKNDLHAVPAYQLIQVPVISGVPLREGKVSGCPEQVQVAPLDGGRIVGIRLSTSTRSWPWSRRARAIWEPMNPAPPVIRMLAIG